MKRGDRVRYFPNVWFENDFHDGTVIDDKGTVRFDDGYDVGERNEQDGVLLRSRDELREMGVNYDEQNNQFTARKKEMSPDDIALALAKNRMQLAYEERSGEIVWLQKDDGDVEFDGSEKMRGYKFVGDKSLPLDVQAKMMTMMSQVAQYVAEHGSNKNSKDNLPAEETLNFREKRSEAGEAGKLLKLNDDEFFVLHDIYRNPGLFNIHHKPAITKKLKTFGFIEVTFPLGYDEGRLYATQAAEDWFLAEKAEAEKSENESI